MISVRAIKGLQFLLAMVLLGCAGSNLPSIPQLDTVQETTQASEATAGETNHQLWSYQLVYVDLSNPDGARVEIIPLRQVSAHLNVLSWLEQSPCGNCVKITNIQPSGNGTLLVDVEIRHPFINLNLTGFDVRGIVMFNASHAFPESGLTISDRTLGDGELVNADGYTSLYNPTTIGHGFEGYLKGKLSTVQVPNATLNGYKRHISDNIGNSRNYFLAGDKVTATYEIDMPAGPFVFGYAVDASWAPPTHKPVENPIVDFDLNANCPEAWQISVSQEPVDDGLTDCGGFVKLTIDVYDWQGVDYVHLPKVECPELFDGAVWTIFNDNGSGWTRYEAFVENLKDAPVGVYRCLVGKEAAENDPVGKSWLDLSGYQLITLEVVHATDLPPEAVAQASKNVVNTNEAVEFYAGDSYDTDCDGQSIVKYEWDWNGDGNFVEGPAQISHSWSLEGIYDVQLRVTDNEGSTDLLDTPLSITVEQPHPVITGIMPAKAGVGTDMTGVIVSGEDFVGPGATITLKKIGETDIAATNVVVVDLTQITCDISIPPTAGLGLYDVELQNGDGQIAVGTEMFEIAVDVPNAPADITPSWLNFSPDDICVDGNYAYIAGGLNGFHIFDISDPADPVWLNRVQTPGSVASVAVTGGFAYALDDTPSLLIIDVSVPGNASIVNQVAMPDTARDVAISGDYAYVTISMQGLAVVDINPPGNASIVSSVFVDIGTDFRVENVAVQGDYAYVTVFEMKDIYYDDLWHLIVVDIHSPTEPSMINSVSGEGNPSGMALTADHAWVLVNHGFFDGDKISFYFTLGLVDISSPEAPVILPAGLYWDGRATSIQVSGTTAFIARREADFCVFDVSSPGSIPLIGSVPVTMNSTSVVLGAGAEYAFLAGEAGLRVIDISPPGSAYVVNTLYTPGSPSCLAVSNDLVFVSNYYGGIQIIDPAFPGGASVIKGFAEELAGNAPHIAVDNGYAFAEDQFDDEFGVLVSDLRIFDVDPPESASQVKWSGTSMGDFAVSSGYAYVAEDDLVVLDVDPPENASVIYTVPGVAGAKAIAVDGNYAYVTNDAIGLIIVDISQPDSAFIVKTVPIFSYSYSLDVENGYAYMISNTGYSLSVVDVDPPEDASLVGDMDLAGNVSDIDVSGGYAYVTTSWLTNQPSALHIVEISNPTAPYLLTSVDLPGRGAQKVAVQGDAAYVTYRDGLMILKLW